MNKKIFCLNIFYIIIGYFNINATTLSSEELNLLSKTKWVTGSSSIVLEIFKYSKVEKLIPKGYLLKKYNQIPLSGGVISNGVHDPNNIASLSGNQASWAGLNDVVRIAENFGSRLDLNATSKKLEDFILEKQTIPLNEGNKIPYEYFVSAPSEDREEYYNQLVIPLESSIKLYFWINNIFDSHIFDYFISTLVHDNINDTYYFRDKFVPIDYIKNAFLSFPFIMTKDIKKNLEEDQFPIVFASSSINNQLFMKTRMGCENEVLFNGEIKLTDIQFICAAKSNIEKLKSKLKNLKNASHISTCSFDDLMNLRNEEQKTMKNMLNKYIDNISIYSFKGWSGCSGLKMKLGNSDSAMSLEEMFSLIQRISEEKNILPYQIEIETGTSSIMGLTNYSFKKEEGLLSRNILSRIALLKEDLDLVKEKSLDVYNLLEDGKGTIGICFQSEDEFLRI